MAHMVGRFRVSMVGSPWFQLLGLKRSKPNCGRLHEAETRAGIATDDAISMALANPKKRSSVEIGDIFLNNITSPQVRTHTPGIFGFHVCLGRVNHVLKLEPWVCPIRQLLLLTQ